MDVRFLRWRLSSARTPVRRNARVFAYDVLLRLAVSPARYFTVVFPEIDAFGLAGSSLAGLRLRILGFHGLTVAVDVDDFPNDAAAVSHDDFGPVTIEAVLTWRVAWLSDRWWWWRFAFWRRWWRVGFRVRVNGPNNLAAGIFVDDLNDVAFAVFVGDPALDAEFVVRLWYRLAFVVVLWDFVADCARAATGYGEPVVVVIPRSMAGHFGESSAIVMRSPCCCFTK